MLKDGVELFCSSFSTLTACHVFLNLAIINIWGNWKTLKAGATEPGTGNGNRTTPFFAYCFDDQVSSGRPPCGTPRLVDKSYCEE